MSPRWVSDPDIRRGRTVMHNLQAHLVFVTRFRREALSDPMLTRCEQIMAEVCDKFDATLIEFRGGEDHAHLLVHYPPTVQVSTLVNSLKGVSARYLRQEFPENIQRSSRGAHLWSPSYLAVSTSGASVAVIDEYLAAQRQPVSVDEGSPTG
ncbi:IS200/IS605 family transposase [Nocardia sp. NPDC052001]|uniref:IS200/IS605 family transposase n=1 Tax=Nocardia sp. NPDC052001 TaxID=3154853 RepID=UPI00342FBC67